MKSPRALYQEFENSYLASYAVRSAKSKGRIRKEKEHDLRTPFQRDRDRIVHSTAFRRLQYKTQVFVNHEGDHYRTRLTHTLETSQIARSIARVLRLNEDLVEAISLAHDLGHGPFGHAGEWALEELMAGNGGFEHNVHGLRIVEDLEDSYAQFPGLNLTFETREGIKKHPEKFYQDRTKRFRSLEADLVDLADEIAYNTHDLDDGLRAGLIADKQVDKVDLWKKCNLYIKKKYPRIDLTHKRRLTIRLIINHLVADLVKSTQMNILKYKIKTCADLQRSSKNIVEFSSEMKKNNIQLKRFLHKNLYQHYHVVSMTEKGQNIIKALFEEYLKKPEQLPKEVIRRKGNRADLKRMICDYLAGMTDRFAIDEYHRLFESVEYF